MEQTQIALKLVLEATGVGTDIGTVDRRKTVQKAVYLAKAAGVHLGYHYNWYLKGPYSPSLTRDYYPLADAVGTPADDSAGYALQDAVLTRLDGIKPAFVVPDGVDLEMGDWLELLASVHFLLTKRRQDREQARATLAKEKAHIVEYFDAAIASLTALDLLDG